EPIQFLKVAESDSSEPGPPQTPSPSPDLAPEPTLPGTGASDPTYRIGKLEAANTPPVVVSPSASTAEAVTTMLYHEFSQLPVMQGDRSLKGVVSWRSLGRALALGKQCSTVLDCCEEAVVVGSDT